MQLVQNCKFRYFEKESQAFLATQEPKIYLLQITLCSHLYEQHLHKSLQDDREQLKSLYLYCFKDYL